MSNALLFFFFFFFFFERGSIPLEKEKPKIKFSVENAWIYKPEYNPTKDRQSARLVLYEQRRLDGAATARMFLAMMVVRENGYKIRLWNKRPGKCGHVQMSCT